jgi:carbon-monoxide dehydrogenase large subunit
LNLGGSILGYAVRRREDPALMEGRGVYTGDLAMEGMLHAAFVRSPLAHGIVTAVDSAATALPGVVALYQGDDLGLRPQLPWRVDPVFARPPLAVRVRYVGDPVAVVVAESERAAVDGAGQVWVEVDPLPVVVDPERALVAGAPVLFPEHGSNLALAESEGDPDPLAGAEVVVVQRLVNQRVAPVPMEPGAILARPEEGGERLTVWLGTQDPFGARSDLAHMLGMEPERIRVIAPAVGGGFGAKGDLYPEHAVVAAAARRLGRPVRWLESRPENLVNMVHGRNQIQYASLGATRQGRITGLDLRIVAGVGAYPAVATWLPRYTLEMASSTYDIPRIRASFESVATNTTPGGPYRGAGRPEAIQMIERMIDLLAAEIGIDPVEVRRRNLAAPFSSPRPTATGAMYDSGDYRKALDHALAISEYPAWVEERDRRRRRHDPLVLGVGVSTYVEVTVGRTPLHDFGAVEVGPDGNITAMVGGSSHGQGHETAFAQIVADRFRVPLDRVAVVQGDTGVVPRGGGTYASRTIQLAGSSLVEASEAVIGRARSMAADLLEAAGADLVIVPEKGLGVAGSPEAVVGWGELAAAAADQPPDRRLAAASDHRQAGPTYPFGAHVAVVELDTETGWARLVRHVGVDDCGTVINPMLVKGQQHGGIAQGAGQALFEEMRFDQDGNPLTANLVTYQIPTATDLPSFIVANTLTPTPFNPLGAKGVGEAGTLGSTPAIHSAVMDALAPFGIKHLDMPLTPARIWAALASRLKDRA